jgi:hypothetical protein
LITNQTQDAERRPKSGSGRDSLVKDQTLVDDQISGLESLTLRQRSLVQQRDQLVARLCSGESEVAAQIAELGQQLKEISDEIASETDKAEMEAIRRAAFETAERSSRARGTFEANLTKAGKFANEFHQHVRNAALAWGEFLDAQKRAGLAHTELRPPLPDDAARLRQLKVDPDGAVTDLRGDTDSNWKSSYNLRPKYRTYQI